MKLSFPACIAIFILGWFSGCLFVFMVLDFDTSHPHSAASKLLPMLHITQITQEGSKANALTSISQQIGGVIQQPGVDSNAASATTTAGVVLPSSLEKATPQRSSEVAVVAEEEGYMLEKEGDNVEVQEGRVEEEDAKKTVEESEPLKESEAATESEGEVAAAESVPVVYEAGVLPDFAPSIAGEGEEEGAKERWLMLDWAVDDRLFSIENYKALESMLLAYPKGVFRVLLAAPNDAYTHKTGNQLSVMHFVKYRRRGYDIEVLPVGPMTGKRPLHGQEYRKKWLTLCCSKCNAKCRVSDHVQPYHVLNFIRLQKIWRRGGIFSDFTFFFMGPLEPPNFTQGYYLNSFCNEVEHMEAWQIEQQTMRIRGVVTQKDREESGAFWKVSKCFTSTLLVFNVERSPIIDCALKKYDDPVFLSCILEDTVYEGAECISKAFKECFAMFDTVNDLAASALDTEADGEAETEEEEVEDGEEEDVTEEEASNRRVRRLQERDLRRSGVRVRMGANGSAFAYHSVEEAGPYTGFDTLWNESVYSEYHEFYDQEETEEKHDLESVEGIDMEEIEEEIEDEDGVEQLVVIEEEMVEYRRVKRGSIVGSGPLPSAVVEVVQRRLGSEIDLLAGAEEGEEEAEGEEEVSAEEETKLAGLGLDLLGEEPFAEEGEGEERPAAPSKVVGEEVGQGGVVPKSLELEADAAISTEEGEQQGVDDKGEKGVEVEEEEKPKAKSKRRPSTKSRTASAKAKTSTSRRRKKAVESSSISSSEGTATSTETEAETEPASVDTAPKKTKRTRKRKPSTVGEEVASAALTLSVDKAPSKRVRAKRGSTSLSSSSSTSRKRSRGVKRTRRTRRPKATLPPRPVDPLLFGLAEAVIEDFNNDPDLASETMMSTKWTIAPHKRILWLGALGWSGHWSSLPYPKDSLLAAIFDRLKGKMLKAPYEDKPGCTRECMHYNKHLSLLKDFKHASYYTGIEDAACTPSIIVPGFMKSASTFLFAAITTHPQVLPPLRGAQLKETYCYHPTPIRKLLKRPWCFPYIEEGENFATADGTVYYSTDPTVALSLKEDNKNVKVVFAIRQPTERVYSNYKFSFETYGAKGTMDYLVERGMTKDDKFGVMRQMLLNGTSDEELVNHYFNAPFKSGGALGVLFMHSIAFASILHYRKVLGPENVMVVNNDDLDVRNMTKLRAKMDEVFAFCGLCPFSLPDMDSVLTGKNVVPPEKEFSQDVYRRLNTFFVPFNNALMRVTGFDLNYWNTKRPPSKLPRFTPGGSNTSLPRAWFEEDDSRIQSLSGGETKSSHTKSDGGLLRALLPREASEGLESEQSGYNTTIGMLAMFR